ncbi:MAG: hypothetical protein R3274_00455, partial [Desulfobacterales bacterium]|nr:hypothetical protein [Desulfobacterales bacterium]
LKKMADDYEWYRDGVKAIMKPSSSEEPVLGSNVTQKIVGLMADIIEAKPSFEAAVEAVLGDALQYIIVQDQDAGLEAIDFLQTRQAGRSGFIPLSSVKPVDSLQTDAPVSGSLLLDQITVKPGYEAIVGALLGHVVFTEDMTEAIQMYNRNGTLKTIVTKNGDVISPQGFLVGGSKDKLNGILAKKQELKTLSRQAVKLDQKLEKARSEQSQLESEARQLEIELQQLSVQKNNAIKSEIEAEKDLVRTSEELKNAERHLEIVRLEKERLQGEANDIAAEMTKYNSALTELSAEVQAAQQKVSQIAAAIDTVSSELEEYQQKVVDLQLQRTALEARLESANNSARRLNEFHNDSLNRLEQLGLEIRTKQQKKENAEQQIVDYDHQLSEMYKNMASLDQLLKSNEAHYRVIDQELQDSDTKISQIKSEREQVLEKVRLLELEQSERKIKKENVASRLEEKYRSAFAVIKADFEQDPGAQELTEGKTIEQLETELATVQNKIDRIVDVNLGAIREYEQLKDRFDFLGEQRDDLESAIEDLHKVIKKINKITQKRFLETFDLINEKLKAVFPRLFGGGLAKLILKEPHLPLETGVEFMIHPPGKKLTRLSLLSGGEKAMAAIAFIFSIFLIKPAAFCLLDEIDAPLDDANVYRFNDLLKVIGEKSQIVMITHNKHSMEFADTLFGITMEEKGISKIVSVNFEAAQSAN